MKKGMLRHVSKDVLKIPDQIVLTSVSEETLLKAKAIEDKSKFFHSEDKGCNLEEQLIFSKFARRYIKIQYCKTHQVDCCRCGWEYGHHYDTTSRMLSGGYNSTAEYECTCAVCGKGFKARRKNALYCKKCKFIVLREQTRNYHAKQHLLGGRNEKISKSYTDRSS